MKKILFTLALAFAVLACNPNENKAPEVAKIELGEAYGPVAVDTSKAISVEEFFADFEQQDSTAEYTIEGKLSQICAKAGCWVGFDKELGNDDYFMVRFKDHFTIPIDTPLGTGAFIHGIARWTETTVEELQAAAKEEGKTQEEIDAITEPSYSFAFLADGIVLKK